MPTFRPPASLIITPSGMRGILGENLFPEVILYFCEAFGSWLREKRELILSSSDKSLKPKKPCRVLVGMDTRTSGPFIKNIAIGALQSVGIEVLDAGVCATPILLFGHKHLNCDGTVIISASHNPPQYNGMKCLAPSGTFLSRQELEEINLYFYGTKPKKYVQWNQIIPIKAITDLTNSYIQWMQRFIDLNVFVDQKKHPLKIIVDPGAGAGVNVTARILSNLGCEVEEINTQMKGLYEFPRGFEPIKAHLSDISHQVVIKKASVGFAHDCDADRLGLINERGEVYPEDIILGLIVDDMLNSEQIKPPKSQRQSIVVTNCASSMIFDDLAAKYHSRIDYTPVGERYLAEHMDELIAQDVHKKQFIFGGEGSCGGVMLPAFNNTRDGIFAAIKIAELLIKTQRPLSELVERLPKYTSLRKNIQIEGGNALALMKKLKATLTTQKVSFELIDNDIKIKGIKEWTLVHPSNTEPIIRIITEATTELQAQKLLDQMDQLLNSSWKI